MDLGVVSRAFPELDNRGVADLLAANGFRCTELCFSQTDSNYWVYNGRGDIAALSDARAREIVGIYRSRGVDVVALGVFTNLLEPNDAELDANIRYFERYMDLAAACGVRYV